MVISIKKFTIVTFLADTGNRPRARVFVPSKYFYPSIFFNVTQGVYLCSGAPKSVTLR